MPFLRPATPAIATQAAVRQLPRWILWLLCLAYALPGFVGRSPWKSVDAASFGAMKLLASGHTDWWRPLAMGDTLDIPALLPYWAGAAFVQWFPQHAEWVVRLPFIAALLATFYLTWQAIFRFALLPSAQPVAFAFGGEASPVDYARSLADGGLLALLACLGLAQLSHEVTPAVFQLLAVSALIRAMASFATPERPLKARAALFWVFGLIAFGLSGAPLLAVAVAILPGPLKWLSARGTSGTKSPDVLALTAWAIGLLCALAIALQLGHVLTNTRLSAEVPTPYSVMALFKLGFWFMWPVWPLAVWTLWRWRAHWGSPHLLGPLWLAMTVVTAGLWTTSPERTLMLALPALALLAAFALPTLKRSVSALIDWFSVIFFSICALIVWVVWVAMLTGIPAKPAANVARLAPGFELTFSTVAFVAAAAGTLAWAWAVRWRLGKHPSALWKSLVLPAGGGTLCWLLLMTLWLPLLDFGRSYEQMARRIEQAIPEQSCIATFGLTQAQVAGLSHHAPLVLQKVSNNPQCDALLVPPNAVSALSQTININQWELKTRVSRLTDNKETLLVYARIQ